MVEIIVPGHSRMAQRSGWARAPAAVFDDFLPKDLAEAMRADIDAHFAKPEAHRPDTHQVWNYWFVPESYTYLRTLPETDQGRSIQCFHDDLASMGARNARSGQCEPTLSQSLCSWLQAGLAQRLSGTAASPSSIR